MALFSPLIISTSSNIARQRYQDSVNDIYSYLQNIYSNTENIISSNTGDTGVRTYCTVAAKIAVENSNGGASKDNTNNNNNSQIGRTSCAIYGKVYFFQRNNDDTSEANGIGTTTIRSYDVVGDILNLDEKDDKGKLDLKDNTPTDILSALYVVHADYLSCEGNTVVIAGQSDSHTFPWDSSLQTVDSKPFEGALLVVRSPLNGAIGSLFLDTSNLNEHQQNIVTAQQEAVDGVRNCANINNASLYSYLKSDADPHFVYNNPNPYSICVASPDVFAYGGASSNRRNIQFKTAMPASSRDVSLMNMDDEENQCQ